MLREPDLTFQGALRALGHYEPDVISKIDTCLGGLILGAGAVALTPLVGPLAVLAPLWAWVDQKNEAMGLLRKLTGNLRGKIDETRGYQRRDLIAAAHTIIVAAAFFETLREHLGDNSMRTLALSKNEQRALVSGPRRPVRETWVSRLYQAKIPAPSPVIGFEENTRNVESWLTDLSLRTEQFFQGIDAWQEIAKDLSLVATDATELYRANYLSLANTVPEFRIWALLGEHAATRLSVETAGREISREVQVNGTALRRIETLLLSIPGNPPVADELRLAVARVNRSELQRPIVLGYANRYDDRLTFPTVAESFIAPRYRIARMDPDCRPADANWWQRKEVRSNLDLTLAGFVVSPEATRLPLLLLGNPGAGKSMLTKVLAAQLPPSDYTVVRVPLRAVSANAPLLDQIQESLDAATHRRVAWPSLADQSSNTVRVVLLDGLDELLQASSADRTSYLREMADFQRIEHEQERPVMIIVTSRTLVADRVEIPAGVAIIKLEDFDPAQIGQWLQSWSEVNRSTLIAGELRELTLDEAMLQPELSRQPLLLLMLAVYLADPASPRLDENSSTTALYQQLFDSFARREVLKDPDVSPNQPDFESLVLDHLERLSVAALAMFNRGVQFVTDIDLGLDISSLQETGTAPADAVELGQRLIGEFFFVHSAEVTLVKRSVDVEGVVRRTYEFLHATFGEYFVAQRVVDTLRSMAAADGGRAAAPEDDFLAAILSHQPLAGRDSVLQFLMELFGSLPVACQGDVVALLPAVLASYRQRRSSGGYAGYQPTQPDLPRELATYSANLVMLQVAFSRVLATDVGLEALFTGDLADAEREWRSIVCLWRAGLEAEGWHAMVAGLELNEGRLSLRAGSIDLRPEFDEFYFARLMGNPASADQVRYGAAIRDGSVLRDEDWVTTMLSWIVPARAGLAAEVVLPRPVDVSVDDRADVATAMGLLLRNWRGASTELPGIIEAYLNLTLASEVDSYALALNVSHHPDLLRSLPRLQDARLYSNGSRRVVLMLLQGRSDGQMAGGPLDGSLNRLVRELAPGLPGEPRGSSDIAELVKVLRGTG